MVLATIDWATAATFATAVGTLVLAVATFAAVRSANRSARVAEASYLVNLRPVLVTSRLQDPVQKMRWADDRWTAVEGAQCSVELVDGRIYLAISLRNVGSGLAVIFGWSVIVGLGTPDIAHTEPDRFRMQTRDLYTAPGDIGFWQGAIRDADDPDYPALSRAIREGAPFTIELLYGDHEGGQRTISRFGLVPHRNTEGEPKWFPSVSRHWYLDRPDPR
ncbi:MAG TPA: hypothetical protein VK283_13375 [Acidimicrobiales bacterium]|nr:hypothetical protein [Acidimicrobiales bacterium]